MIDIIEDEYKMSIEKLKEKVKNSNIELTSGAIKGFLNESFKKNHYDVLKRNQMKKDFYDPLNHSKTSPNYVKYFESYINLPSLNFYDNLITKKYEYDPETLKFYKDSIDILRKKALLLISIIEKISSIDIVDIKDLLVNLDIALNEAGNIKYEDIIRIIKPTIDIINDLFDKVKIANDLDTYLNVKMSEKALSKTGISYEERRIGPELQLKNIEQDNLGFKGYIPLSNNQREILMKKDEEYFEDIVKVLTKVF